MAIHPVQATQALDTLGLENRASIGRFCSQQPRWRAKPQSEGYVIHPLVPTRVDCRDSARPSTNFIESMNQTPYESTGWYDDFPPLEQYQILGLCPALAIAGCDGAPRAFSFGPFVLLKFEWACMHDKVAARYQRLVDAYERRREGPGGASVLAYVRKDSLGVGERPGVAVSLWPILVLSITSWARMNHSGPGMSGYVPAAEAFFVPAITPHPDGENCSYSTGIELGFDEPEFVPLRWDVEQVHELDCLKYNRALAFACDAVSKNSGDYTDCQRLRLLGSAADLANASIEHSVLKVQNVSQAARSYTLLLSGFEALHRVHAEAEGWNPFGEIAKGCGERLKSRHSWLTEYAHHKVGRKESMALGEGTEWNLIEYVIHELGRSRNYLAHGRDSVHWKQRLPKGIGGHPIAVVGKIIFDQLLSQDFLELVGSPVASGNEHVCLESGTGPDFRTMVGIHQDLGVVDDRLSGSLGRKT